MLEQFGLDLVHMAGTEIQAQRGLQGRQAGQRLALRGAGAAAGAAEHNRLHQPRDRQLLVEGGRRCLVGTEARHHLDRQTGIGQTGDLLSQSAIETGITVVQAHHPLAGPGPVEHHGHHLLQGEGAGAQALAAFRRQGCDLGIDQRIGPDEHLGLLDQPGGAQGEQIGGSRAGANNPDGMGLGHRGTPLGSGNERCRP